MGWLRALFDAVTPHPPVVLTSAQFSGESPMLPVDQLLSKWWREAGGGGSVTRDVALSVPAVLRGRNMICGEIGGLPLVMRGPDRRIVNSPFLEQIDPDVPNIVTLTQTLEDLLFDGVSVWYVEPHWLDEAGFPLYARHIARDAWSVQQDSKRTPAPLPYGEDPRNGEIYIEGKPANWSQVRMFTSPNPPLLTAGASAIRRARLLDDTAELYAGNPRPLDYLTPIEGVTSLTDEQVDEVIAGWERQRRAHSTAWLENAEYHSVDQPTPADLQLEPLKRLVMLELANQMGLDPEDVGVSTTSRTYQNAVDRRRDRINGTLQPYMRAVTDRLSMGDTTRRGYTVAFDPNGYLEADPKTRAEVDAMDLQNGIRTREEIRAARGLPALTPDQAQELDREPIRVQATVGKPVPEIGAE